MTATFDPQQYLAGLEAAGAPKKQASIHARTLSVALKGVVAIWTLTGLLPAWAGKWAKWKRGSMFALIAYVLNSRQR